MVGILAVDHPVKQSPTPLAAVHHFVDSHDVPAPLTPPVFGIAVQSITRTVLCMIYCSHPSRRHGFKLTDIRFSPVLNLCDVVSDHRAFAVPSL